MGLRSALEQAPRDHGADSDDDDDDIIFNKDVRMKYRGKVVDF